MNKKAIVHINTILILICLFIISSCSKHQPAPVKDSSYKKYRNGSTQSISKHRRYQRNFIVVKKGDTLYSIGFSNNLDYKKLASINNIRAPYSIYPGQRLSLKGNNTQSKRVTTSPIVIKKPITSSQPITKAKSAYKKPQKTTKSVIAKTPKITTQKTPSANSKWIWPVKGKIISTFSQSDTSRKGLDISSKVGNSVKASNNGSVVYSGDGLRGYGELIIIKHSNNLLSAYAHNSKRLVKEGQMVKQGQEIAKTGKESNGKALLHFEIRKNGKPVNPLNYLPKR